MYDQAKKSLHGEKYIVKIPITNSKGEKTSGIIKKLLENSIKCNVTAILTLKQVEEIYKFQIQITNIIISILLAE